MSEASAQNVLITGASSGLGEEFARQFHRRGCSLILVARRAERLERLCAELNAARPGSASYFVCDLSRPAECEELAGRVRRMELDVLINNAGRGSYGPFEQLELESEIEEVALNVIAPMRLAHAVIPQMKAQGGGTIIAVSSVAGFQPVPLMATYSATKAFNLFHAMALRDELAACGIRVITVCPGPTRTEFRQVAKVPDYTEGLDLGSAEQVVAETLRAMDKNSPWLVPCFRVRFIFYLLRLLPLSLSTRLTGFVMRAKAGNKKKVGAGTGRCKTRADWSV